MSVELDPMELTFQRPFDHEVSQTLRLRNPSDIPIAFKIKTTAPRQYCVRPNSGRIEPNDVVEVQMLLQAMKQDPPTDVKCKDKFLVQSIPITVDNEFTNIQAVWSHIEATSKSTIQETKIRVAYLPAHGTSHDNDHGHSTTDFADESFEHGSASPTPGTPHNGTEAAYTSGHQSKNHSTPDHHEKSGVAAAVSAVTDAIPTTTEELKAKLADAQTMISQLQTQAKDSLLRQRKTDAVSKDAQDRLTTGMGVQQAPAGGVPVQIVAALCLLCFLLAYLFF